MDFSSLLAKVKEFAGSENVKDTVKKVANNENVKKVVKKVANNKAVKKTVSKAKKAASDASKKVSKVAKAVGIDTNAIVAQVLKNKAIVDILVKLGLKKESAPESSAVQKLVASLKSNISKATGIKLEDKSFSSAVSKVLANAKIKEKLEDVAGRGVPSFIKKAVEAYISE